MSRPESRLLEPPELPGLGGLQSPRGSLGQGECLLDELEGAGFGRHRAQTAREIRVEPGGIDQKRVAPPPFGEGAAEVGDLSAQRFASQNGDAQDPRAGPSKPRASSGSMPPRPPRARASMEQTCAGDPVDSASPASVASRRAAWLTATAWRQSRFKASIAAPTPRRRAPPRTRFEQREFLELRPRASEAEGPARIGLGNGGETGSRRGIPGPARRCPRERRGCQPRCDRAQR